MKSQTLRRLRQLHHYVGVFFAPAILLFALSGSLQTFRLQEERGYGGPPPGWIVWLASVHKDQALPRAGDHGDDHRHHDDARMVTPAGRPGVPDAPGAPAGGTRRHASFALKVFVGLLGIALIVSTLLGVAIALSIPTMRRVSIVMLVAGTALPLLFLLA